MSVMTAECEVQAGSKGLLIVPVLTNASTSWLSILHERIVQNY